MTHGLKRAIVAIFVLSALSIAALGSANAAGKRILTGHVRADGPATLPPGARVEIKLLDVSLMDAAAVVLAQTTLRGRKLPLAYRLAYDPARLKPQMRYTLQARIMVGDRLIYISTTHIPVTGAERRMDIPVEKVEKSADQDSTLWMSWLAEDIGGAGVIDNAQSTITLASEGRMTGSGGCNAINGAIRISPGNRITFGDIASTMKMCVPALMDQERRFLAALGKTRRWRIDAQKSKLYLLGEAGQNLVVFSRK